MFFSLSEEGHGLRCITGNTLAPSSISSGTSEEMTPPWSVRRLRSLQDDGDEVAFELADLLSSAMQ